MKIFLLISIVLALGVLFSCAGSKKTKLENSISQQVLLSYNFINHAWGYQNNGKFLDKDGNIKSFKVDKAYKNSWVVPQNGEISKEALGANYARAKEIVSTVSAEETSRAYKLIKQLATAKIEYSTTKMQRNDYGGHDSYAYLWDATTNKYKAILLKRSNDRIEQVIKNPEGIALLAILNKKEGEKER